MGTTYTKPPEDDFDNARRTNLDEMSISFEDLTINTENIQTSGEPVVPEPSTTHALPTRDTEINTGAINPPEDVLCMVERVEAVRDREDRDDGPYYLIKWQDYPEEENTWEPLSNCQGCMSLINEFNNARRTNLLEELNKRFDNLCTAINTGNIQTSGEPVVPEPSTEINMGGAINPPDDSIFQVEAVLGKRILHGKVHYLLKWKDTWEPLSNCQQAANLIQELEKQLLQRNGSAGCAECSSYQANSQTSDEPVVPELRDSDSVEVDVESNQKSESTPGWKSKGATTCGNSHAENKLPTQDDDISLSGPETASCSWQGRRRPNALSMPTESLSDMVRPRYIHSSLPAEPIPRKAYHTIDQLRKCSSEEIEIVGAEPYSADGIYVGVRAVDNDYTFKVDSSDVTELWPKPYIAFLEEHIRFGPKET